MLFYILGFLVLVFGGGFIWWFLEEFIDGVQSSVVDRFPTYFDAGPLSFIDSVQDAMLVFLIIGGIIWLITSASRTTPGGYYP